MDLSIIVIFYDMVREAERTLLSLSRPYQCNVAALDYEIIAIDNASADPLPPALLGQLGPGISYHFHQTDSPSPVDAINMGIGLARGRHVAVIVDGARMASPGLVSRTCQATRIFDNPVIASLSWHIGPKVQNLSMLDGYNQAVEDELLEQAGWIDDGYRLFEISALAQSSAPGFFGGFPPEASWLCASQEYWMKLGGYDPRFQSPGGGLVNHDVVNRIAADTSVSPIVLLGEGVFHQYHGGVATNVELKNHPGKRFKEEFLSIRGEEYSPMKMGHVSYFGDLCPAARRFISFYPAQ